MAQVYIPTPEPIVRPDGRMTEVFQRFLQNVVKNLGLSGTGSVTNTGDLAADALVIGTGGSNIETLGTLGTNIKVLHGNSGGAPNFSAVVENDLSLTDVTTANVLTTRHGFAPKLPNDATKYLDGTGAYTVPTGSGSGTVTHTGALTDHFVVLGNGTDDIQVIAGIGTSGQVLTSNGAGADPTFQSISGTGTVTNTGTLTNHALIKGNGGVDVSALGSLGTTTTLLHGNASGDPTFGAVVEADLSLTNVTTANVTTSAHGFAPILPNDSTKFLNGVGGYSVPAGTGTGNITSTGTEASLPGSPTAGDLYFPNDGFWVQRYSGSGAVWAPWGPVYPMKDPGIYAPTTWVNQGSSTISTTTGAFILATPSHSGLSIRSRVKTNPSTPYTITAWFIPTMLFNGANTDSVGLLFRDSASSKLSLFALGCASTVLVSNCTNDTTFSASPAGPFTPLISGRPICLRIADNGTNRIYSLSYDGTTFLDLYSVTRTTFLTPDQVGFFVNSGANQSMVTMTLLSWVEA